MKINYRTCDRLSDSIGAFISEAIEDLPTHEQVYVLESLDDIVSNLRYDIDEKRGAA